MPRYDWGNNNQPYRSVREYEDYRNQRYEALLTGVPPRYINPSQIVRRRLRTYEAHSSQEANPRVRNDVEEVWHSMGDDLPDLDNLFREAAEARRKHKTRRLLIELDEFDFLASYDEVSDNPVILNVQITDEDCNRRNLDRFDEHDSIL